MKWEILDHQILFQRHFQLEKYSLRYQRFDGGSNEVEREIFERGNSVAVLPYDARRDELVLIEQFRPGAVQFSDNPWLFELVAGVIEDGESIENVAQREATEEAGCALGELIKIHHLLLSPGGSTESCAIFVADVDTEGLGGLHGVDAEHEDIKVHVASRMQAIEMMNDGRIVNAVTVIGLQWLALHYQELLQRWGDLP